MSLLERLMPRIDKVAGYISRVGLSGMCNVAHEAHRNGEITDAEYAALAVTIDSYTKEHDCAGFVVFYLVPEFDDMTDNPEDFEFPNETSERAAKLWKEWAVGIVKQVQETLDAVRDTSEDR